MSGNVTGGFDIMLELNEEGVRAFLITQLGGMPGGIQLGPFPFMVDTLAGDLTLGFWSIVSGRNGTGNAVSFTTDSSNGIDLIMSAQTIQIRIPAGGTVREFNRGITIAIPLVLSVRTPPPPPDQREIFLNYRPNLFEVSAMVRDFDPAGGLLEMALIDSRIPNRSILNQITTDVLKTFFETVGFPRTGRRLTDPIRVPSGDPPVEIRDVHAKVIRPRPPNAGGSLAFLLTASTPRRGVLDNVSTSQVTSPATVALTISTQFILDTFCKALSTPPRGLPGLMPSDFSAPCHLIAPRPVTLGTVTGTLNTMDVSLQNNAINTQALFQTILPGEFLAAFVGMNITSTLSIGPDATMRTSLIFNHQVQVTVDLHLSPMMWFFFAFTAFVIAFFPLGPWLAGALMTIVTTLDVIAFAIGRGSPEAGSAPGMVRTRLDAATPPVLLPAALGALFPNGMLPLSVNIDDVCVGYRLLGPGPDPIRRSDSDLRISPGFGLDLDLGRLETSLPTHEFPHGTDLQWSYGHAGLALTAGSPARFTVLRITSLDEVTLGDFRALRFPLPGGFVAADQIPVLSGPPDEGSLPDPRRRPLFVAVQTTLRRFAKCALWRDVAGYLHVRYVTYDTAPSLVTVGQDPVILESVYLQSGYELVLAASYREFRVRRQLTFTPVTVLLVEPLRIAWSLDDFPLEGSGKVQLSNGEVVFFAIDHDRRLILRTSLGQSIVCRITLTVTDATGFEEHATVNVALYGTERHYSRSEFDVVYQTVTVPDFVPSDKPAWVDLRDVSQSFLRAMERGAGMQEGSLEPATIAKLLDKQMGGKQE